MYLVAYPGYMRDKAVQLRTERKLTLDEIAERLALPKTTVYYWIRDIPIPRTTKESAAQLRRARDNSERARRKREEDYRAGRAEFEDLSTEPRFLQFVVLYIAEGYKRNRNEVSLSNSDPEVIVFATRWIRRLASNPVTFRFQHHADQGPRELQRFWGALLGVEPTEIKALRKANSSGLARRQWRCEHGVLQVRTGDTAFRSRLQAWIELTKKRWLDSYRSGA